MASTEYESELAELSSTYQTAIAADLSKIKKAIAGASDFSVIGVGSGGSFTVASLLCNLHEAYTGRVSRPSTPLEIICNPTLASASPVFLISAEGRNPDAIEVLKRARIRSASAFHVITNRSLSPLVESANALTDINLHIFELSKKDGYLATNSLLLDAVIVARAYGELDNDDQTLPLTMRELVLADRTVDKWISDADTFASKAASTGNIIIVFSPLLRPVATDLESKLSESALLHCQLADLRSFAHGRHLWLAERAEDCTILSIVEPSLSLLWSETRSLFPGNIPTLTMSLNGAKPRDLLAGLIAQMKFVSSVAAHLGKDPGRPEVPEFGRRMHYADISSSIVSNLDTSQSAERSKFAVLGAKWPSIPRSGSMRRALESFKSTLADQTFRAIVFDYDGTLCSSQRNDYPPIDAISSELRRLIEGGVVVGIASGRGGSIQEALQKSIPESLWPKIYIGLYNCGSITDLASPPSFGQTSEFLSHVTRIVRRLKDLGAPIEMIRPTHPFQVSVRFQQGVNIDVNWFVIADALRQSGLEISSVVRSKHSVDILAAGVNKSHLIAHIIKLSKVDPYQVLTIGDQGAWPGNDSSLLDHRFSLSVDEPSRRLDRGWKLAPNYKRDVDATQWYLERIEVLDGGMFRLNMADIAK